MYPEVQRTGRLSMKTQEKSISFIKRLSRRGGNDGKGPSMEGQATDSSLLEDDGTSLSNCDLWKAPLTQEGEASDLSRTQIATEGILEKLNPATIQPTSPVKPGQKKSHQTKRRETSWRKLSNVGRPRLVSWRHLQSDTSSDGDSSISSSDERTAPTHASTVTEENERTVKVSVVQEDGIHLPVAEEDAASIKQHIDQAEHYSESLNDYRQSVATSMEAGSLWSENFDEAHNEKSVVSVPKASSSAEADFVKSFSIDVDEFFKKQEGANADKSDQAKESPSDEGSVAWKEPLPQVSILADSSNQIGFKNCETIDTACSSNDSVWDDIEVRPMKGEDWTPRHDQAAKTNSVASKRDAQRTRSTKDIANQVEDVVPETKMTNVKVPVRAGSPLSSPVVWLMDQRKRAKEARIAIQRDRRSSKSKAIAVTSSEAARAKRTRKNPRRSGNVRVALQFSRLKADCSGLCGACTAATVETWNLAIAIGEYVMDEVANSCSICVKHEHEEEIVEQRPRDQNVRRSKRDRYSAPVAEVMLNQTQALVENASEDFLDDAPQKPTQVPTAQATRRAFPERAPGHSQLSQVQVSNQDLASFGFDDDRFLPAGKTNVQRPRTLKTTKRNPFIEANLEDDPYFSSVAFDEPAADAGGRTSSNKFESHCADDTLLQDVDRFMLTLRPIKECQQQVQALKQDFTRSKEERAREARFWRQHEAKWKTRLPFHNAQVTYSDVDVHFS